MDADNEDGDILIDHHHEGPIIYAIERWLREIDTNNIHLPGGSNLSITRVCPDVSMPGERNKC